MRKVDLASITCAEVGCPNTLTVNGRHLDNFLGRDWFCRAHERNT